MQKVGKNGLQEEHKNWLSNAKWACTHARTKHTYETINEKKEATHLKKKKKEQEQYMEGSRGGKVRENDIL